MRSSKAIALALAATCCTSGCYLIFDPDRFQYSEDAGPAQDGDSGPHQPDSGLDGGGNTEDGGCSATCGGVCTALRSDPMHCGSCDHACATIEHGSPTCADGTCGFVCDPGYTPVLGTCREYLAPRPIAPLSTATATSRRPTFRWELAPRSDGARIEICADRACTIVIATLDASGTSGAPTTDLPTGIVFWRLYGRNGADVSVDPSSTWELVVGAGSADVDASWGCTPDVNGDGFADLLVGAPGANSSTGRVAVFLGDVSGFADTASITLDGEASSDSFGIAVAPAGDVNGDGFVDVIIGASGANSGTGRAYIYLGGESGLSAAAMTTLTGMRSSAAFGLSVASAGDLNGDGFADVVVGAPGVISSTGAAYVFLGGASGVGTTPMATFEGSATGEHFGSAVASAGDVNGDGFGDLAIGAYGANRVAVCLGSSSGVGIAPDTTLAGTASSLFGNSVSCDDVNGDGYADLVVGAPVAGSAYVYSGSASGLEMAPAATLDGPSSSSFGLSVAGAGDLNGDGFGDLVVGASRASSTGNAFLYLGSATGVASSPLTTLTGVASGGRFGVEVAGIGDANGDGFADIVVGADGVASATGSAYVFLGDTDGVSTSSSTTVAGDAAGDQLGISVATR